VTVLPQEAMTTAARVPDERTQSRGSATGGIFTPSAIVVGTIRRGDMVGFMP
jgi:hypothetical protein